MWLSRIPYGDLVTESAHQARLCCSTWYDSQAQKFSKHQAGLMICHFEWALWGINLDSWPTLTFREGFPGSALGPGFFLLLVSSCGGGRSISCMSVTMDFIIMTSITSTWPLSSSWVQHLISGQPGLHHLPHLHHPRFWAHSGRQGLVHGRLSFIRLHIR